MEEEDYKTHHTDMTFLLRRNTDMTFLLRRLIAGNTHLEPVEKEEILQNLSSISEGIEEKRDKELAAILWAFHLPDDKQPVYRRCQIMVLCCQDGPLTPLAEIR